MRHAISLLAGLLLCTNAAWAASGSTWGYEGAQGPEHWGALSPEFITCAKGHNQSPIDIRSAVKAELPALHTQYAAGPATIINNGHTIQVNFAAGSTLALDGESFELKQVHFHAPGENKIAGKSFPFEAHFVHADPQGALAVIGVMYEAGAVNTGLNPIWAELPAQAGPAHPLKAAINPADLLPANMDYYRFSGSLTTPPCTEGVRWLVLQKPIQISAEQIQAFTKILGDTTNRPVQPLHGRLVIQ